MSGPEFKTICERKGLKAEDVADAVDVHVNTVWMWFRSAVLDRRTQLALTQLGFISMNEGKRGAERTVRA